MYITRDFYFEAAHYLSDHNGNCKRMHGHSYKVSITIKGKIKNNGMVIDFSKFKETVNIHAINQLDHGVLNNIIKKPTAEELAIHIWIKLIAFLPLYEVKIWETKDCSATYRGKYESK